MTKISLSSYRLRLKKKRSKSYLKIDNFSGGLDLSDILKSYLRNRGDTVSHDSEKKKLLRVVTLNSNERILTGIIETGEYGYESDLYNVISGTVTHRRETHEAELLPFYFFIEIPRNAEEGTIILQRFQQFGIKTLLLDDFTKYFGRQHPNLLVEMNPLIPEDMIKQSLNKGRITKIRCIRLNVPNDIADAYDIQNKEEDYYIELVVSAKRNKRLPNLNPFKKYLDDRTGLNKLIELKYFEYDNIKVEVDLQGTRRTIDLAHLHKIRAYYDITQQVKIGADGHPSFDTIDEIAKDLSENLKRLLKPTEGDNSNDR